MTNLMTTGLTVDTLPEWLYQRFAGNRPYAPAWNTLSDGDRDYWTRWADAVRRAAERSGFKVPTATPAPCHCGQPVPADRVAYCSRECRFEDDDHGPDTEPEPAGGEDA